MTTTELTNQETGCTDGHTQHKWREYGQGGQRAPRCLRCGMANPYMSRDTLRRRLRQQHLARQQITLHDLEQVQDASGHIRWMTCGHCDHPLHVDATRIIYSPHRDRPVLEGPCPACGTFNTARVPRAFAALVARKAQERSDAPRADVTAFLRGGS